MKLAAFRDKDRAHLRDPVSVGLADELWLPGISTTCANVSPSSSPRPRDDSPLVSKCHWGEVESGTPNRKERISRSNPFLPETHFPSKILDSKADPNGIKLRAI